MARYSIGVDFGGTKILAAVVDVETGRIIGSAKKKSKKEKGSEVVLKRLIETIENAVFESEIPLSQIDSIGIGVAGQVDRKNGILISAPNLDFHHVDLKRIIEDELKVETLIGNDVEVATLGEMTFGSGREYDNFVCIFVGTGIGGGIVINHKLYQGACGTAGEVGHIVIENGGRHCGCGASGCLEAYASRTAIEKRIRSYIKKGHKTIITDLLEDDDKVIRSKHLKIAVKEGDEVVLSCLNEAAAYLSAGIASIVNFLNPEIIILGGGLTESVDYYYDMVAKKTVFKALPTPAKHIKFAKAMLGDYSGVIGAALLKTYYSQIN